MRIRSLRTFLILTIISTLLLSTITTIVWSYNTINKNISRLFDILLVDTANNLRIFLRGDLVHKNLHKMQDDFSQLDSTRTKFVHAGTKSFIKIDDSILWAEQFTENYESEAIFQVWTIKPSKLILHSSYAPSEQLTEFQSGFKNIKYKQKSYRVFTQINPKLNLVIQTAQDYTMRNDLADTIIRERLYPLVIVTPVLLLIILFAIKIASDSIKRVSGSIKIRDPKKLDMLNIKYAPKEVLPLVIEINRLFALINDSFAREQRFNSDAAHELKTPLAAIKIQAEVAKKLLVDSPALTNLDHIITAVNRSDHIVSQLLILSRLSPNQPVDNPTDCYIDKIAREIIADIINHSNNNKNKNISISFDCDYNNIPPIKGNKVLLGILVRNLIDNAIKYSGSDSKVNLNLSFTNKTITLEISDNGPGIPNKLKSRIFDRFYRVPGTSTDGSGLGLSIVKLIADLHNAKVKVVDNITGQGLTVVVVFLLS
ncbi:MAG: hypothetical protein KBD64_00580 [Gammaproteobacteria bacterium]|nr:hypothetical protein [Gammaproteobacteria bacterium]